MLLWEDAVEHRSEGKKLLQIEAQALQATAEVLNEDFDQAVEMIYKSKGRVVITGMGKSGIIGQKIAATLASTGTPAIFLHPGEALHGDLGMVQKGDVVLALSNSGETREILAIIPSLRLIGTKLISITGQRESNLIKQADLALEFVMEKEGCPLDLAPMASTTATLALGDALAAALMQKRNFTPRDFSVFHPHGSLGKMLTPISKVMHSDNLPIVRRETPLAEVIDIMVSTNRGGVIVAGSKGHLRGFISDGDLKRHLRKYGPDIFDHHAEDLMIVEPKYIEQDELLEEAIIFMNQNKIGVLPVCAAHKKIVGIVQLHDLMNYHP